MLKKDKSMCDLCGLIVEVSGFNVEVKDGSTLVFCCSGCLSVYRLLNGDKVKESS